MGIIEFMILLFLVVGFVLLVLYFIDEINNDCVLVLGIVLILVGLYFLYQRFFKKKSNDGYGS